MSTVPEFTDKMKRFITAFAVSDHGGQSAMAAGYSKKSAANQACQILKKPGVREAIDALRNKATAIESRDTVADIVEVKEMLTKILRADMSDFMENGVPCPVKIAAADLSAVSEYTMLKTGPKITMHSKMAAADRLAKLGGWEKGGGVGSVIINLTQVEMKMIGQQSTADVTQKEIEVTNETQD